ncbi:choice-of-anchor L domain-containing protein [Massilia sp. PWRC2]|uniref:choice-of-anchor L domain-containing protein n=1 Tax=Massilia sp. PWRC2 TaxID=2804626 RepID=UPI003CEF1FA8
MRMHPPASQIVKTAVSAAIALAMFASNANAVVVTTVPATSTGVTAMADAVLASNSGISIVANTVKIQGTNSAAIQQYGTYSNFNLAPKTGTTPTLTMADGVVLTSGKAVVPLTNTSPNFSTTTGSGANAQLSALSGSVTNDANTLGFDFTVESGVSSVSAKFVFGTEEFPDQAVTDIFGFFIDGVNYAKFSNGSLISNAVGSNNFISNVAGAYGIEYDGLTNVLTVTGLLNQALLTHTLMFGVADTSDSVYDSAVYLNSLTAGLSGVGGLSSDVPEPSTVFLLGIALAGGALARRKQSSK